MPSIYGKFSSFSLLFQRNFNRPLRFSTPSIRANDSLELRVKKIYTYIYVCREMEIETKRGNFLILTR